MTGRQGIECETRTGGGRWYIPAPIVYGVVISVVVSALGGGGSGLIMAIKLDQALNKIHALPSAQQLNDWKQQQHQIDKMQDSRLDRLEHKVFNLQSLNDSTFHFNCPFPLQHHGRVVHNYVLHDSHMARRFRKPDSA